MTAPVSLDPYQPNPYQQPGQQQGLTPAEEAVILAVAAYLASVVAVRAVTLPTYLVDRFVTLGLPRRAVRAAGKLTLEPALTGRTRWGSPTVSPEPSNTTSGFAGATPGSSIPSLLIPGSTGSTLQRARTAITGKTVSRFGPQTMVRKMAANEPLMRARYLLAAARRLAKAAAKGEFTAGLRREKTYLEAHRRAGLRRARISREYDEVAKGQAFMRYVAVMDSRTTPDCAALNGSIWHVSNPPFPPPGARHVACRCSAVPVGTPHTTALVAA